MIKDFVDIWNDHKGEILSKYEEKETPSYNHTYRDGDKEQAMEDIERYALNILQSFKEV